MAINKLTLTAIIRKCNFHYEEVQNFQGSSNVFQGSHLAKCQGIFQCLIEILVCLCPFYEMFIQDAL